MKNLTTYIIVFDTTQRQNSWMAVHQYIKDSRDFVAYWNYIPLIYMVKTYMTALELAQKLRLIIPESNFMTAEVNVYNINGILPKQAWDWIYADHTRPQPEIDWMELMKLPGPGQQ